MGHSGAASYQYKRGMWVWDGHAVAKSPNAFLEGCVGINVTDVYLYLEHYEDVVAIRALIAQLSAAGIRAWGLDGSRKYFSDIDGHEPLYSLVQAMIAYNDSVDIDERFYGFQTNNEPWVVLKDVVHKDLFHGGVPTSELQSDEVKDRHFILQDWLAMQKAIYELCHANRLAAGAAVPSWLDEYYDEELLVEFAGVEQNVMQHMMNYLDDYCIMSYRTDVQEVQRRVVGALQHAHQLPGQRVNVWPGLETCKGLGGNVTYADCGARASKSAVLEDMATMEHLFSEFSGSFAGINIHDWDGWAALPDYVEVQAAT